MKRLVLIIALLFTGVAFSQAFDSGTTYYKGVLVTYAIGQIDNTSPDTILKSNVAFDKAFLGGKRIYKTLILKEHFQIVTSIINLYNVKEHEQYSLYITYAGREYYNIIFTKSGNYEVFAYGVTNR